MMSEYPHLCGLEFLVTESSRSSSILFTTVEFYEQYEQDGGKNGEGSFYVNSYF